MTVIMSGLPFQVRGVPPIWREGLAALQQMAASFAGWVAGQGSGCLMACGKRSVTAGVVDGIGLPLTGRDPISPRRRCDVYIPCSSHGLVGTTKLELRTDSFGRSLECHSTDSEPKELDRLALMLRQPLWPRTEMASRWTYMMPSIRPGEKPIEVRCSLTSEGGDLLKLKQIVDSIDLDGGKTYIEVTLHVNQVTGRLKTVYEWCEHGGLDPTHPVTAYSERY